MCDEQCGIAIDIPIMENIPDNIVLRKIHGFGSLVFGFIVSFLGVQRRRERIRADNHKDIIFIRKVSNWKTILSTS